MLFLSEKQAESVECLLPMQAASVDDDGDVVIRLSLVILLKCGVDVTCGRCFHTLANPHTHTGNQDTRHGEVGKNLERFALVHKCCHELELAQATQSLFIIC